MIYICKTQPFIDGNKRSATLFANHFLLSKGKGMIVVGKDLIKEFKENLLEYYEYDNEKNIIKFLKEKCIVKFDDNKTERTVIEDDENQEKI